MQGLPGKLILYGFVLSGSVILEAEEFVVGDRDVTVSNFTISPSGLSAGDTVLFQGDIVADHMGVMIHPAPSGLTLKFSEDSSVLATHRDSTGILVGSPFDGTFVHEGRTTASFAGICFVQGFSGTAWNSGSVFAGQSGVVFGAGTFSGSFTNSGRILGGEDGVFVMDSFEGTILNTGTIEGTSRYGIHLMQGNGGNVRNEGGRIVGGESAIYLGAGDGRVVLSGFSQIEGGIDGGADSDTLRFEKMRGVSEAKRAELQAAADADAASGSITLFGEVIEWKNFEAIEVDLASLVSYESLITAPGLSGYARALDNASGHTDEFREFLQAMSEVDDADLNAVAANSSGQTLISAWDNFGREQDSRLFSLFGSQFSSLRGSVSGRENQGSANANGGGIFSNEVPAGGAWNVPDRDTSVFVSGFVGSGDQDPSLNRADAQFDATTVVFGVGRQVSDHWNLGVFGGYGRNEARIDQFGSELETRSAYAGVNAQFVNGSFFTNVLAGYGFLDSDSDRRDFLGNEMTGNRNGHQGLFYFQIGWDHAFGDEGRGRVTPYLGLALSTTSLDAFSESGPAATSLRFRDETMSSVQSVLGLSVTGHQETRAGWVRPSLDVSFWQALDGAETSTLSLVNSGLLNPYSISTSGADESRAVLQLGTDFSFDAMPNWIFNAGYFGSFGEDGYSSHGGMLGVKIDF